MDEAEANEDWEVVQLSLLSDFLYCPRRAALKAVEGCWGENAHTVLGEISHQHADLPGYEVAKGVTLLRALPVFSRRLGLSGRCDIVEQSDDGSLSPVEYKKGRRRQFANDDAQLCAQALCLEEMTGRTVVAGAIFFVATKRRRPVEFTVGLRQSTKRAIGEMHALVAAARVPAAMHKPSCTECSLYSICLPQLSSRPERAASLAAALFRT